MKKRKWGSHGEPEDLDSVLAEQRREIAKAKTLQSDQDLAFNLQMQEAITASLSVNPSSSRSPPRNVSVLVPEEDTFDYVALLVEDLERLDQERRDREKSESLMKKVKEDLDRRIHDQKVASEIMKITDDEWEVFGDNYHKPYGCSSSSSRGDLVMVSCENFKLYCKGIVSEERIRDMNVIVAGVGAAICDSEDNVIFEVSKGLEVGFSEGRISESQVKIEALIEGFNAALSLDLQNVTFFCDDFMVYQYVTGRVQPTESKISTLLNQVSLLQKKFPSCNSSFVTRSDIKFAFKLARDAIVSQIMFPETTNKSKNRMKETCVICYEDKDVGQIFTIDGCLHRYCFSCMKQHVEVKLLNNMEAKCPREGCESEVSIHSCGKFLDPKLVDIIIQRKKEASIAVTDKVYCPYPRCSTLMSKREVLEYTKLSFVGAEQSGARKCVKCRMFFCINCRVPWHYKMKCREYKASHPNLMAEDAMLNSLAKKKLWRQCVRCNHMVELAEGCYHITCRCGYEFCYTCGAEWKNKKATCKCPIWDEANIIRDRRRR